MSNLLEQTICTDDGDRAAKIIQQAFGIKSDDVARYCFPRTWLIDREQRARIIGEWVLAPFRRAGPFLKTGAGPFWTLCAS